MHAADLAFIDLLRAYATRIASAGHGAKSAVVAEACERLQMSQATLYKPLERQRERPAAARHPQGQDGNARRHQQPAGRAHRSGA